MLKLIRVVSDYSTWHICFNRLLKYSWTKYFIIYFLTFHDCVCNITFPTWTFHWNDSLKCYFLVLCFNCFRLKSLWKYLLLSLNTYKCRNDTYVYISSLCMITYYFHSMIPNFEIMIPLITRLKLMGGKVGIWRRFDISFHSC